MVDALIDRCRAQGWTIAVAESCTGGLLGGALTAVAGSSDVFVGGVIAYSNAAKATLIDVPLILIRTDGAVSEAVARAMATGVRLRLGSTIGIAVTGVAGPGCSAGKPEGRVCFGLSWAGRPPQARTVEFGPLGRAVIREKSVAYAVEYVAETPELAGV